jgi:hypothetical protein
MTLAPEPTLFIAIISSALKKYSPNSININITPFKKQKRMLSPAIAKATSSLYLTSVTV